MLYKGLILSVTATQKVRKCATTYMSLRSVLPNCMSKGQEQTNTFFSVQHLYITCGKSEN